MNLEPLNKLINDVKESNLVQNFIKELSEHIERSGTNVTAEYRDKMNIERRNILENYAKETADKGTMYYIYDKSANSYLATICEEGQSHEIINLTEADLPQEAGIDSVLRMRDGKYILDNEATECVKKEISEKFDELLKEQSKVMKEHRVEGHVYEFVEASKDRVWLIDNDANNGAVFEEFEFDRKVFSNAKEGDLFQYINGNYEPKIAQ